MNTPTAAELTVTECTVTAECIYCTEVLPVEQMSASELVRPGRKYPGIQFLCQYTRPCLHRIHVRFHQAAPARGCHECQSA